MTVRIASALARRLLAEAAASPHAEVCGLLFGDTAIAAAVACRNVAADIAHAFEIDPAALFAALRAERAGGPRLIGHYHSHPRGGPTPSPRDAAMALDAGRLWLIVGDGRIGAWRATGGGGFAAEQLAIVADGCETGQLPPQGAA